MADLICNNGPPPPRPPLSAADSNLAAHVAALLDELRWLHDHGVKLHLKPTKQGWNLKVSIPDP